MIKKYGEETTKLLILDYFEDENNLKDFAVFFPDHLSVPLPEHQREILESVPRVRRLGVAAPRGSGKSTTTNIVVLSYYSLFNKSPFSLLVSDTLTQAKLHLDSLKYELEENQWIKWLFGNVIDTTWGAEFIVLNTRYGKSAITCRGAGQKIRGLKWHSHRPGLVVIDDLENDELVSNRERRGKIERWFKTNLLSGLSKKWNKVVFLGTILHDKALIKKIIGREKGYRGWDTIFYKAIKSDGSSYWEEMFPIAYLVGVRDDSNHPEYLGSITFNQEFQNTPRTQGERIVQEDWVLFYSLSIKEDNFVDSLRRVYITVDPAISDKHGSSDFALQVLGLDNDGHKWHLQTVRDKLSINKQIEEIFDKYERWNPDLVAIESIAYQKVLRQLVEDEGRKRGVYPKIKEIYTDTSKERRMEKASSQFEAGLVHLNRDDPESQTLLEQIIDFPEEPNDSADALVMGLELTMKKRKAKAHARKPAGW